MIHEVNIDPSISHSDIMRFFHAKQNRDLLLLGAIHKHGNWAIRYEGIEVHLPGQLGEISIAERAKKKFMDHKKLSREKPKRTRCTEPGTGIQNPMDNFQKRERYNENDNRIM